MKKAFRTICTISFFIHLSMFVMLLLPSDWTKDFRHFMARVTLYIWTKESRLLGIVHDDFWQKGNGK